VFSVLELFRQGGALVCTAFRILVVDDSEVVRNGIRDILISGSQEWAICGEVADGEQIIARSVEL
jgi:hypothetical protein